VVEFAYDWWELRLQWTTREGLGLGPAEAVGHKRERTTPLTSASSEGDVCVARFLEASHAQVTRFLLHAQVSTSACRLATTPVRLETSATESSSTTVTYHCASAIAELAHVPQASVLSTAAMLTQRTVPGSLPDLQHEWQVDTTITASNTEQGRLEQEETESGALLRVKSEACNEKWYLVHQNMPTALHELVQRPITIQESPWCAATAAFPQLKLLCARDDSNFAEGCL
jgi:hypothetical protein